jgi:hypothetical protein
MAFRLDDSKTNCLAFVAGALVLAFLAALLPGKEPVRPPKVSLSSPVEILAPNVYIDCVALVPDNESLIVGGSSDLRVPTTDADLESAPAGGAIVNLKTKSLESFTNGHRARILSVGALFDGSAIVSTSTKRDPNLRILELKTRKSFEPIALAKADMHWGNTVSCYSRARKFAFIGKKSISIFDLADKEARVDIDAAWLDGFPEEPIISHDDRYLACRTPKGTVVVWDLNEKKVAYSASLVPDGSDHMNWMVDAMAFRESGKQLVFVRDGNDKVAPNVLAANRGLFAIDIAKKQLTRLEIGQLFRTPLSIAVSPGGEWLATVGHGQPDKPDKDNPQRLVAELRVYHFPTRTLATKVQFDPEEFFPTWVGFTPDGKKVLAVQKGQTGRIRAWDFSAIKP